MQSQHSTTRLTEQLSRKRILVIVGVLALAITNLWLYQRFNFVFLRCWLYEITHFYCPGCGTTRMVIALLHGDIAQAFRYNSLVFILLPFLLLGLGGEIYSRLRGGENFVNRVPKIVWVVLITAALGFGVLRNLAQFSFLAPGG